MNPSALPQGTVIRLTGERADAVELQRIENGWTELTYHCVDCAATWTYESDGLKGDYNSEAMHLPEEGLDAILEREGTWEVVSVPAEWLRDAILEVFEAERQDGSADALDVLRQCALDAGLS